MNGEFFLTALIVVLMPGTGVAYTLAATLGQGRRAGCIAAFGCTLGILPHLALSTAGVAALLVASPVAFETFKALGVAFLAWMAWRVWRGTGAIQIDPGRAPLRARRLVIDGVLLNALNPKLSVFFLAFLPQFVPPSAPDAGRRMMILALVFMLMTLAAFLLYAVFASALRRRVVENPRALSYLRAGFAVSFAVLGLRLALT